MTLFDEIYDSEAVLDEMARQWVFAAFPPDERGVSPFVEADWVNAQGVIGSLQDLVDIVNTRRYRDERGVHDAFNELTHMARELGEFARRRRTPEYTQIVLGMRERRRPAIRPRQPPSAAPAASHRRSKGKVIRKQQTAKKNKKQKRNT